jgi:hypothetical protein
MSEPPIGWYCTGRDSHHYAIVSPGFIVWPLEVPGVRTGPLPVVLRCPECGLTRRVGRRERKRLAGRGEADISTLGY